MSHYPICDLVSETYNWIHLDHAPLKYIHNDHILGQWKNTHCNNNWNNMRYKSFTKFCCWIDLLYTFQKTRNELRFLFRGRPPISAGQGCNCYCILPIDIWRKGKRQRQQYVTFRDQIELTFTHVKRRMLRRTIFIIYSNPGINFRTVASNTDHSFEGIIIYAIFVNADLLRIVQVLSTRVINYVHQKSKYHCNCYADYLNFCN